MILGDLDGPNFILGDCHSSILSLLVDIGKGKKGDIRRKLSPCMTKVNTVFNFCFRQGRI